MNYHILYTSIGHDRNSNLSNMRMTIGEPIALETQFDLTVKFLPEDNLGMWNHP